MRIAFVYDRINKFGGAERILLTLHEIWPNAPIYTGIYDAKKASWSKIFEIKPSFLKYFPFIKTKHEIFPTLTPYAFEVMVFDSYDVVLTITSSDAKGIITKPQTLHICYCLTPTRYLWSGYRDYLEQPGLGIINPLARHLMRSLFTKLRYWDNIASLRPDYYFSISKNVARRIKKYYHHNSIVIYPPVEEKVFKYNRKSHSKDYYLVVSRLVPYKKIDYVINAFNKIGLRLIIIGKGIDENRLSKEAKPNIEFIKRDLTDRELCCYYQGCRALIFPGEEDFGLTGKEIDPDKIINGTFRENKIPKISILPPKKSIP